MLSTQTALTLAGASTGLVSAIWFSAGAWFATPREIVRAADDSFDANPGTADWLVAQSAQYLAGGILLLVSFAIQIAAALVDPNTPASLLQVFSDGPGVAPAVVLATSGIVSLLLSYPAYKWRKCYLLKKVEQEKQSKRP